jgi:hypothetical protein
MFDDLEKRMSNSKVIDLYTKEGDLVAYRPLSARLPAFLERFGPERDFAVRTEIADTLSLKPGLLRLYEAALQAGRKPEELGLPALALAGQTLVCRATLENGSGRVLATATAAKPIQAYKDLEVLETAARQRLLAALGFGGDALDEDESLDQADQGFVAPPPAPAIPEARPAPPPVLPTADAPSERETTPAVPDAASAGFGPVPEDPAAPANDDAALALLRRQIDNLARMRGVEPPVVATREEARAALKRLMQGTAR